MTPTLTPPAGGAITAARLQLFAPRCDYLAVAARLDAAARAHAITTPRQVRHWLAQLHHESFGLTVTDENLNYSAAELHETWPSHFASIAAATPYAHNPQAIAGVVYGGRMGNRDAADGYTYRGRGYVELTGRAAYAAAGKRLGQPYEATPDLVATPAGAALTAADFWAAHNCNQILADHADETAAATAIRRVINGGEIGLAEVLQLARRAATIWRD